MHPGMPCGVETRRAICYNEHNYIRCGDETMMGYLFVIMALMVGAAKGFCGKKTSSAITTLSGTLLFNSVRMLICIPIGLAAVFLAAGSLSSLAVDGRTLLISLLSGAATSFFVVSWIAAVRRGAYMLVDVFLTLGVAVPVVLCRVFFGESVRVSQVIGILMLVAASYVMCSYNMSLRKERMKLADYLLLAFSGAANGLTSFAQKWFRYESAADASVFNFYTYVFSAAVLIICWLTVRGREEKKETAGGNILRLGLYVTVMSVCIFLHSLFSTMAAGYLTSSQLYPLMQGGGLTLSMLMAHVFFGEKITPRCLAGIAIAFAALMVINLM